MIVVENRLREIFNTLPQVNIPDANGNPVPYSVSFDWGTIEDLNLWLKQNATYPLIWLETGFEETHNSSKEEVSVALSFKIATSGLKSSLLNQQRIASTFDLVLFPVLENVRKAFERANTVQLQNTDWKILKFYNWSTTEGMETTQVWDALRFDVELIINGDCLKNFNYG